MSDLHVVLGATGGIGSAVLAELKARGHRVRAVSRGAAGRPDDTATDAAGTDTDAAGTDTDIAGTDVSTAITADVSTVTSADFISADVTTTEGAIAACAGATVVYQCAQPPYGRWPEEFPGLTRAVIAGVEAAGARLVMPDNLYVYGPVDGPMTEDLPYRADFPKGRARAEVDRLIMEAHDAGRIRATLGRASDYYGPGGVNTVLGPTVFAAALKGRTARWIGDVDQPHSVSYLPDIAAGLVTLGEHAEADGRTWHLPVAAPITGRDFLSLVYAEAGGTPKIAGLSRTGQRLVGLFNPIVRELGETWYQRDRPFVADDSAFRTAFGPVKVTPHAEGVAATLAWYRDNPR